MKNVSIVGYVFVFNIFVIVFIKCVCGMVSDRDDTFIFFYLCDFFREKESRVDYLLFFSKSNVYTSIYRCLFFF